MALPVDVSVGRSVQSLIDDIRVKFNTAPSIVVNSAGITRDNFLLKMDENSWNAVMNVNLKVRIICDQHILFYTVTCTSEPFCNNRGHILLHKLLLLPFWMTKFQLVVSSILPQLLVKQEIWGSATMLQAKQELKLLQDLYPRNLLSMLTFKFDTIYFNIKKKFKVQHKM